MVKQPNRLWIVVLLLGWAFDFLFWKQSAGLNVAVFLTLCLLVGSLLLLSYSIRPADKSLWLLLPYAFFAVMTFLRQEPLTLFLAYVFTLVSAGLLIVTYRGGRWMQYSLLDYGKQAILFLFNLIVAPLEFFSQVRKDRVERGVTRQGFPVRPVLRGFVIALPVLILFTYLLSSADLVFNQRVTDFLDEFRFNKFSENLERIGLIFSIAYLLAGTFLHAAARSRDEKLLNEDHPVIKSFLGFTEATIVLGSVAALFFFFVTIQFRYFFGGAENIGVQGYTYSEYARRGFNELVAVAFLSLLLTLGLNILAKRENEVQRRVYSGLCIAIAALVLVILVSAFQRLMLAISWHGYSRLRLYPSIFLIWVGVLFVVVVALEATHRERYFAFAALLAAIGFGVSLSVYNVDAMIVHYNVDRAQLGWNFNVNHLTTLSADAVPALVNEYRDPALPKKVREGLGVALLCHYYSGNISWDTDVDWRSMDLSQHQAALAMKSVKDSLKGYQVNKEEYLTRVGTPSNVWYDCAR